MHAQWAGILAALGGTALGSLVTIWSGRSARKAAADQAATDHLRRRTDSARELAAESFALAVEAVQWLHPDHVEDSTIDGPLKDRYEPEFKANIAKLRESRRSLLKVASLTPVFTLRATSEAVARELGILDDAWDSARGWSVHMRRSTEARKAHQRMFVTSMDRLVAARKALNGLEEDLIHSEYDVGGIANDDCLLARLRDAIAED